MDYTFWAPLHSFGCCICHRFDYRHAPAKGSRSCEPDPMGNQTQSLSGCVESSRWLSVSQSASEGSPVHRHVFRVTRRIYVFWYRTSCRQPRKNVGNGFGPDESCHATHVAPVRNSLFARPLSFRCTTSHPDVATPLISSLRAVILEGASLLQLLPQAAILGAWGVITFVLALRWFRWM